MFFLSVNHKDIAFDNIIAIKRVLDTRNYIKLELADGTSETSYYPSEVSCSDAYEYMLEEMVEYSWCAPAGFLSSFNAKYVRLVQQTGAHLRVELTNSIVLYSFPTDDTEALSESYTSLKSLIAASATKARSTTTTYASFKNRLGLSSDGGSCASKTWETRPFNSVDGPVSGEEITPSEGNTVYLARGVYNVRVVAKVDPTVGLSLLRIYGDVTEGALLTSMFQSGVSGTLELDGTVVINPEGEDGESISIEQWSTVAVADTGFGASPGVDDPEGNDSHVLLSMTITKIVNSQPA